jgi:hypothetical protein
MVVWNDFVTVFFFRRTRVMLQLLVCGPGANDCKYAEIVHDNGTRREQQAAMQTNVCSRCILRCPRHIVEGGFEKFGLDEMFFVM